MTVFSPLLASLFLGAGAAAVVIGMVASRRAQVSDAEEYLRGLDRPDRDSDEFEARLSEPFVRRVALPLGAKLLQSLGRFTPVGQRDKVSRQLVQAGMETSIRADEFVALQTILTIIGFVLGVLYLRFGHGSRTTSLAIFLLLPAAAYLGPQAVLARRVNERKEALFLDMPDVLDLLAISVEAGTGFEGALQIVCSNMVSPLADEFSRTLKEMELGLPRKEALENLRKRTEVPELSNFVLALIQADALGMPIGRVLHTQSQEMRSKRRQWAREKAAKLPVKILFPLVLFIFPAVMIIVLGPAASSISRSLR